MEERQRALNAGSHSVEPLRKPKRDNL